MRDNLLFIQVLSQALGHFKGITLMAENGHFERPAISQWSGGSDCSSGSSNYFSHTEKNAATAVAAQQSPNNSRQSSKNDGGWLITTPEVDLSWMDPVESSCQYFEQRTPGSLVLRTATSVTFNYHNAQR